MSKLKQQFLANYGTAEHAVNALNSGDDELHSAAAANPFLPESHMYKIMSDKTDWNGRWGLSQNGSTPTKIIDVLTRHKDGELQRNALVHPNVSASSVDAALSNPSTWTGAIEHIVKYSPHITKDQLHTVLADNSGKMHSYIKGAAKERLEDSK